MGGNIGTAILELEPPAAARIHVIEMSSFQIELTPSLAPSIGVLLNVTPDHLDRHGTMEHYAALKARLVEAARRVVIGEDDDWCRDIAGACGWPAAAGSIACPRASAWPMAGTPTAPSSSPARPGPARSAPSPTSPASARCAAATTCQNALAASACALMLGVSPGEVAAALATFPGLPHRLEEIGRRGARAVHQRQQGHQRRQHRHRARRLRARRLLDPGRQAQAGRHHQPRAVLPRIARAYLIGEATEEFAATLEGKVAFERCGTLDVALAAAARDAAAQRRRAEPVVLLSPACASYDQYPNFEVRGDRFRTLATALPGIALRGAKA